MAVFPLKGCPYPGHNVQMCTEDQCIRTPDVPIRICCMHNGLILWGEDVLTFIGPILCVDKMSAQEYAM